MSARNKTYLDTVCLYYEEEVEGDFYFDELSKAFANPDHREKLALLAKVERHAAKGVAPLVERHGLTPRSETSLETSGRAGARNSSTDWGEVVTEMNQSYPGYLDDFRALQAMGPPEDQRLLSFLTEHEVAALEFLRLEAIDPSASAAPLRAYLATRPEDWAGGQVA